MSLGSEKKGFKCPVCGCDVSIEMLSKGGSFPFCSQRCRLIDLGKWVDCDYKIPVESTLLSDLPDEEQEY